MDELIPLTEAAKEAGVPYRRAYDDALAGQLVLSRVWGRWVVTRDSLDRYLAARAT